MSQSRKHLSVTDLFGIIVIWGALAGTTIGCAIYHSPASIIGLVGLIPAYFLTKWIIL